MRRWWIGYSLGLRLCALGASHADERWRHPSRRGQGGARALALGRLTARRRIKRRMTMTSCIAIRRRMRP